MSKETFFKLNVSKREAITKAFLREFSLKSFDDASLTSVVKELGIAKGSIYQYFNNKLDLFTYLISECNNVKSKYMADVNRDNYADFWQYYAELIRKGIVFDKEHPAYSNFLFRLEHNLNSKTTFDLFSKYQSEMLEAYEKIVHDEIYQGNFRQDISAPSMSYLLYKANLSISEQFIIKAGIDLKQYIKETRPVIQGNEKLYQFIAEEYIELLKASFSPIF